MNSETVNNSIADRVLNYGAVFWFLVAVVGQWLFVYYITAHYGGNGVSGNYEAWGKTSLKGHIAGDYLGNFFFASHMLMAIVITLGGSIQLVPYIRERAAKLHRWNGRIFIFIAIALSLGGFYLVWVRGASLHLVGALGVSLNGVLIIAFAIIAIQLARSGDYEAHRRWALRAFIVVNGVWFFRVGFMGWIVINQGPLWSTEDLDGPFDMVWVFANYLLPLGILELYLYVKDKGSDASKYAMSVTLFVCSLVTAVGIFGAYMFMWRPNL